MPAPKKGIRKISWKALCVAHDKHMNKDITVYQFGRRVFKEKAKKPTGYP